MDIFYLISKIFTFFLAPEIWIAFLLVWRVFAKLRATKKRLLVGVIFIFLLFSNEAIYKISVSAWQPSPVVIVNKTYAAAIVLGGFVGFDDDGKGYLKKDADRFYEACKLYKLGVVRKIVVSGGTVAKGVPEEADFIKSEMLAMGILKEDIISETTSKTTFENAQFTKLILDSMQLKPPYVLITSAMHMPRAARLFSKAGVPIIAFPAAYGVIENEQLTALDWLIPKTRILGEWPMFIKEIVGVIVYSTFNKA